MRVNKRFDSEELQMLRNMKLLNNDKIKNILLVLLGNTIFATAIAMFIIPNQIISGGTTGLAIFLNRQYGVNMTLFIYAFNIVMFLLGWYFLGKKFALTTVLSTLYYPFILGILQKIPGISMVLDDKFMAVIFAGVVIGVGIGIVIKVDASTGGIDIPPLILNKKFGIPVAVTLWALDIIIILLQVVASEKESIFYGIVLIVTYTTVLNRVLLVGKSQIQVKVISKKYKEINEMILSKIDRGSTLVHSQSGYEKNDGFMVVSVINNRELNHMNRLILEIDPEAFIIVSQVNEVRGKGFTLPKHI